MEPIGMKREKVFVWEEGTDQQEEMRRVWEGRNKRNSQISKFNFYILLDLLFYMFYSNSNTFMLIQGNFISYDKYFSNVTIYFIQRFK